MELVDLKKLLMAKARKFPHAQQTTWADQAILLQVRFVSPFQLLDLDLDAQSEYDGNH